MPNTNNKRFGRLKGQVNSALKDGLGNLIASTYITNVTYDSGTLYFWSGSTLKYSCTIDPEAEDYIDAPLTLLGVGYDPEDPETQCGVDISVPSGSDVYRYSSDLGQTWRGLHPGVNRFYLYTGTGTIQLKIQADRTSTFNSSNYLSISTFGRVEAYNNVNSLLSPNFATLTDLTTVVGSGVNCFYNLFEGCTGLTRAPLLPATTLASNCYSAMFQNCTSLTQAPLLPATTLAVSCYSNMFYGCSSLNEVRISATDISAFGCLSNWLSGVAATGDFYCVGVVEYPNGASGKPSGWVRRGI